MPADVKAAGYVALLMISYLVLLMFAKAISAEAPPPDEEQ